MSRSSPSRAPFTVLAAVVLSAFLVAGGFVASAVASNHERENLEERASAAESDVQRLTIAVDVLDADRAELRRSLADAQLELGRSQEHAATVEAALAQTSQSLDALQADGDLTELLDAYHDLSAQVARWDQLQPVSSTELPGPALYIDRSIREVVTTKAICSGSMEPTITCSDLLVLFKPSSVTELDVGDIIYFKQPSSDCGSSVEGRFVLHRIDRVVSNAEGVFFQTKGDAFSVPDACLVPIEDVLYELLATVRDSSTG